MPNVQPGDLAVIVRDCFEVNVNRVVEVVGPASEAIGTFGEPGLNWRVRCPTKLAVGYWHSQLRRVVGPTYWDQEGHVLDANLRRISGPERELDIDLASMERGELSPYEEIDVGVFVVTPQTDTVSERG